MVAADVIDNSNSLVATLKAELAIGLLWADGLAPAVTSNWRNITFGILPTHHYTMEYAERMEGRLEKLIVKFC